MHPEQLGGSSVEKRAEAKGIAHKARPSLNFFKSKQNNLWILKSYVITRKMPRDQEFIEQLFLYTEMLNMMRARQFGPYWQTAPAVPIEYLHNCLFLHIL
jgi:hypothetical protein